MLRVIGNVYSDRWKAIVLPRKVTEHAEEYNVAVLPEKVNGNTRVHTVNVGDERGELDVLPKKTNDEATTGGASLSFCPLRLTIRLQCFRPT